jgi:hypothetical protein
MIEPPEVFRSIRREPTYVDSNLHIVWPYLFRDKREPYAKLQVELNDGIWAVRLFLVENHKDLEIRVFYPYTRGTTEEANLRELDVSMKAAVCVLQGHLRKAQARLEALDALNDPPEQTETPTFWDRLEAP